MKRIDFEEDRRRMVEDQISRRGIQSPRLLDAFLKVPRHRFVSERQRQYAYQDRPLRISLGQTISQPYIVAYMTDKLQLEGDERVLEIGTGSGYQAAILGVLAKEVHSVERHSALAVNASQLLADLAFDNVHVHIGDGTGGLEDHAPYQGIVVTAAGPDIPRALLDQLAEGGRLVMPVGSRGGQHLVLIERRGDDFLRETLTPVVFVPLIGEHGWEG